MTQVLKSLSDETRYELVKLLLSHDYCVGALAQKMGISDPAASQHLKTMRNAGIVKGDKRGYFTHYYVDRDFLKETAKKLIELSELPKSPQECSRSGSKYCCRKEE